MAFEDLSADKFAELLDLLAPELDSEATQFWWLVDSWLDPAEDSQSTRAALDLFLTARDRAVERGTNADRSTGPARPAPMAVDRPSEIWVARLKKRDRR